MTWWIIRNPAAGRGEDMSRRLDAALDTSSVDARVVVSRSAEHIVELVAEGRRRGFTRFASVGGDGTAHWLVNGLMALGWEEPPTMAIVPAGSGSDFIRTFALPRTLEGGVALLAGERTYRCDVGRIEGSFGSRWFLNAANLGLVALSAQRAARLPARLGALRYTTAFWLSLATFGRAEVTVDLGRRSIEDRAVTVVVANGQFFGGGLNVAPQASLQDGMVDIEVFTCSKWRAFDVMPRVIKGNHLRHPAVRRGRSARLVVTVPDDWPVEADGELVGAGAVEISVVGGAVDFAI